MHTESKGRASNLVFGASGVTNSATSRFLGPGYSSSAALATTCDYQVAAPFTVTRIDYSARVVGGAGGNMIGTLRKNGVATAAVLTTVSTAANGSVTLATPISFSAGDSIGFQVDKSAGFTSPTDLFYVLGISN